MKTGNILYTVAILGVVAFAGYKYAKYQERLNDIKKKANS